MGARILSGKEVARTIRGEVAVQAERLARELGRPPGLTVLMAGDDPASQVYVGRKEKASAAVGIRFGRVQLSPETTQEEALAAIEALNADPAVDGFLVQLPLYDHLDERPVEPAFPPERVVLLHAFPSVL